MFLDYKVLWKLCTLPFVVSLTMISGHDIIFPPIFGAEVHPVHYIVLLVGKLKQKFAIFSGLFEIW